MNKKYRHELKFLCTEVDFAIIESRIRLMMKPDAHVGEDGKYLIRSVYFDDFYRTCFYDNENGIDPREKYRIRVYDKSPEVISLEKKIKKNGMTGKKSVRIEASFCKDMLSGCGVEKSLSICGSDSLLDEFMLKYRSRFMRPTVLIEYVRKPFVYPLGNVRVTFDMNISASRNTTGLFDENIEKLSVLPTGQHILEVKYDDYLPDVIGQMVCNRHRKQCTFSKYYLGCKALEGRI